ncbi:MAG: hypothetical protein R6U19_03025 [Bacteroidales bacterium]
MKYLKNKGKNRSTGVPFKSLAIFCVFCVISLSSPGQHKLSIIRADSSYAEFSLPQGNAAVFQKLETFSLQYKKQGFFQASFDSIHITPDSSIAIFNKGPQYEINSKITGNIINSQDTQKITFNNYETLNEHINKYLNQYRNNGYPFASAQSGVSHIDSNIIHLTISIDKGDYIRIDTVICDQPSPPLSVSFLMAYLQIKKGDAFRQKKIKSIKEKIDRLEFVELKYGPSLIFKQRYAGIKLQLNKKPSSSFDGIIGFTTARDNKLRISGNVTLDLLNAFKEGEALFIDWSAPGNESQSLHLKTGIPYLGGTPFGANARFEMHKQDSSFLNLNFRGGLEYRFSYKQAIEAFFKAETSNVTSSFGSQPQSQNLNYNTHGFGIGYTYSTLDSRIFPQKGWNLLTEFTGSAKNIRQDASWPEAFYDTLTMSTRLAEIYLLAEKYLKPGQRTVFLFRNQTKALQDNTITYNQLYRLGGFHNLKGFDENLFRVSAFSMLLLEYRLLLEERSFLAAFWNGAVTKGINKEIHYPMGFGAGFSFHTGTGIFTLYYALGKQHDNPVEFRNSKIHFGFKSTF